MGYVLEEKGEKLSKVRSGKEGIEVGNITGIEVRVNFNKTYQVLLRLTA